MTRARFRIVCDSCDLVVEAPGPSIVYAVAQARELGHDHSDELAIEYATRGGYSRVGGPRPPVPSSELSEWLEPDPLSEALLALDDEPAIEITE